MQCSLGRNRNIPIKTAYTGLFVAFHNLYSLMFCDFGGIQREGSESAENKKNQENSARTKIFFPPRGKFFKRARFPEPRTRRILLLSRIPIGDSLKVKPANSFAYSFTPCSRHCEWISSLRGKEHDLQQRPALSFSFPVLSLLGKVSHREFRSFASYSTHILFDLYLIHAVLTHRGHAINDVPPNGMVCNGYRN